MYLVRFENYYEYHEEFTMLKKMKLKDDCSLKGNKEELLQYFFICLHIIKLFLTYISVVLILKTYFSYLIQRQADLFTS